MNLNNENNELFILQGTHHLCRQRGRMAGYCSSIMRMVGYCSNLMRMAGYCSSFMTPPFSCQKETRVETFLLKSASDRISVVPNWPIAHSISQYV